MAYLISLFNEHQSYDYNHIVLCPCNFKAELIHFIHGVAVLDVVTVCTQQALGNATRLRRTWVDSIWINTIRRRIIKTVLLSVRGVANVFVRREDITPVGVAAEGGLCPTAVREIGRAHV